MIDLFAAIEDVEDADSQLVYTIESNTNAALFESTLRSARQGYPKRERLPRMQQDCRH